MDKFTRTVIAIFMMGMATVLTIVIASLVAMKDIPLDSIGLWVISALPISLYSGSVAILIKEW